MAHNMLPLSELFKAFELRLSQGWEPPHLPIPQSTIITLNKPPFIMETPTNPSVQTAATTSQPEPLTVSVDKELAQSILQEMADMLDAHHAKASELPSTLVAVANLLAATASIFKDNLEDVQINGKPVHLDCEYMTLDTLKRAGLKYDLDFSKYLKLEE